MRNIITNFIVRTADVDPELTVSAQPSGIFVEIRHLAGDPTSIRATIESIKEEVRSQLQLAIAPCLKKNGGTFQRCATVSLDINAEQPELRLKIWDPVTFNANFDQNFTKLISVASDMLEQWCTNIDADGGTPCRGVNDPFF